MPKRHLTHQQAVTRSLKLNYAGFGITWSFNGWLSRSLSPTESRHHRAESFATFTAGSKVSSRICSHASPQRTRLQRLLATHRDRTDRFLAPPTFFTVTDSYGIEPIHPTCLPEVVGRRVSRCCRHRKTSRPNSASEFGPQVTAFYLIASGEIVGVVLRSTSTNGYNNTLIASQD